MSLRLVDLSRASRSRQPAHSAGWSVLGAAPSARRSACPRDALRWNDASVTYGEMIGYAGFSKAPALAAESRVHPGHLQDYSGLSLLPDCLLFSDRTLAPAHHFSRSGFHQSRGFRATRPRSGGRPSEARQSDEEVAPSLGASRGWLTGARRAPPSTDHARASTRACRERSIS